jgi:hypothetical protein
VVSAHCCESAGNRIACETNAGSTALLRRWYAVTLLIVPAGGLALLPKCPACLAAYLAIVTGVSISVSTAAYLRMVLLTLSIALIAYFVGGRRWRQLISAAASNPSPEVAKNWSACLPANDL